MKRRTIREAFRSHVLQVSGIGDACRVLLLHMATVPTVGTEGGHPMTDSGRIKVSRQELAEALGVKPQRITDRITEATRAGLLRRVAGGHNGQTAVYLAQLEGTRKGIGRTDTYSGPESLAGLVKVTAEPIPTHALSDPVGIGRTDPIRARALLTELREQERAPDESRVERDDDVTEQAGNYRGWPSAPSKRLSA